MTMDLSLLMRSLDTLRREYAGRRSEEAKSKGVLPPPLDIRELTIEVGLHVVRGADGEERLELVEGASNPGVSGSPTSCHRLTLKLGSPASSGAVAVTGSAKRAMVPDAVIIADAEGESAAGGDEATLLRRLEIVLGGPPGFTTGAKAEILADLLREFGRAALVENLHRVWVSQFDTGADSSSSVTKG